MEWSSLFGRDRQPASQDLELFINTPQWEHFLQFMEVTCPVPSRMEYSGCSMQPGWNMKYKKSGKNLFTVYPASGYFICMILIGPGEAAEAEFMLPSFSSYMQQLYQSTQLFKGTRWLMVEVRDEETLNDLKELILIKMRSLNIKPLSS